MEDTNRVTRQNDIHARAVGINTSHIGYRFLEVPMCGRYAMRREMQQKMSEDLVAAAMVVVLEYLHALVLTDSANAMTQKLSAGCEELVWHH